MTPRTPSTIRLSAPLELRSSAAAKLPSSFVGTAYSGGLVKSYGVVIDLSSTKADAPMPLLSEHQRTAIVGLVASASIASNSLGVTGALYSDMPGTEAERIAQLSQRGFPFQMSVGLYGYSEEWVPAGVAVSVNGQAFSGPVTVLRNGRVRECSICALGADPATDAKFFADPAISAAPQNPVVQATINRLLARIAEEQRVAAVLDHQTMYERRRLQAAESAHRLSDEAPRVAALSASDIYTARRAQAGAFK